MTQPHLWGNSPIEVEVRYRIKAAIAAYAYEIADAPIMTDHEFDRLVQSIHPEMGTCHPLIDDFFAGKFSPMTGMWIHEHPQLARIAQIFETHYRR
jgi:hypothetical protein